MHAVKFADWEITSFHPVISVVYLRGIAAHQLNLLPTVSCILQYFREIQIRYSGLLLLGESTPSVRAPGHL